MEDIESKIEYFLNLVLNNIKLAKEKREERDVVLLNIKVNSKTQTVEVYNKDKNEKYELCCKDLEDALYCLANNIKNKTSELAIIYIDRLVKYNNNQIDFKELESDIKIANLIKEKDNIIEQLKTLCKYREMPGVQSYIEKLEDYEYTSEYLKYLIDKYYYNKKDLIKPNKNDLEKMFKMKLRM